MLNYKYMTLCIRLMKTDWGCSLYFYGHCCCPYQWLLSTVLDQMSKLDFIILCKITDTHFVAGLGPNASQLQQLLKQKSGMTSASVGSSVFEIQSITKFQDVWMAKCSIIDGAITVASKSYDDAYVLFKTECDTMFTSGMKFRCQNSSKFSGPDGLFVCADEVLIL